MKLTFMGTAGARFMVAKQVAASGGLYIEEGDTRMSLDPGPGAIVQYAQRGIDLTTLDAIVVSHRHLDHAGDLNVMVEGVEAKIGLHVCYGNRYGKPAWEGSYRYLFPAILEARVHQLTLEPTW